MQSERIVVGGGKNPFICTMKLGSGWAAVMLAEYADMGGELDVVQTGIGRYATEVEAIKEGKEWAEAEEMEFKANA